MKLLLTITLLLCPWIGISSNPQEQIAFALTQDQTSRIKTLYDAKIKAEKEFDEYSKSLAKTYKHDGEVQFSTDFKVMLPKASGSTILWYGKPAVGYTTTLTDVR